MVRDSSQLFEEALAWLKDNYKSFRFFAERDIVWTLQTHMMEEVEGLKLPLRIYDNHKLAWGKQADLVLLNPDNSADTTAEVKYEPDHHRADVDISAGKLNPSKVFWNSKTYGGVEPDIDRIRKFVTQGITRIGISIFIDEGSYHSWRSPPEGSKWVDWGQSPYSNARISVLIARFPSL